MVCPRCGGPLVFYQLGDAETMACQDCTYVGIAVDHTADGGERESWDDALDRFHEQHEQTGTDETSAQPTEDTESDGNASKSDDESGTDESIAETDESVDDSQTE